ncbi:MAG: hypothetical protein AAF799_30175 [Myxococcota bacterium]
MNIISRPNEFQSSPSISRWIARAGLSLVSVLTLCACDLEERGPEEEIEALAVDSDGTDPFPDAPVELRAEGVDLPTSEMNGFCHKLEVKVADCRGNFVNGVYTWDPQKGYHLQKHWEDYIFSDYVKASESSPQNWAIIYEGFHRNGDWHPAYTEVAKATGPGLPDEATWPAGVTVRCLQ